MKSIRWKLVIMYIALVFIVMISTGTFLIYSIRNNENANARSSLKDISDNIYENVIKGNTEEKFKENFENLIRVPSGFEAYVIRNSDGATIESTTKSYNLFSNSVVLLARDGKEAFSSSRKYAGGSEEGFKPWMELGVPVKDYVIFVRKDATATFESFAQTTRTVALSVVLALTATVLIGLLFANTLTSPISMLTKKTKEFAKGNMTEPIKVQAKDEIGQLTESFNNMAHDLNATISQMESEKNKMEIVLYNMTDGVLAYDSAGKNIHANNVCAEMLGISDEDTPKLSFTEMLVGLGLTAEHQGYDSENTKNTMVSIGEKYISLTFNPYKNKDGRIEGIIIVLQDITRHMKLDNMRKEFVANVSHEIRTPITTIKSYTETLLDGAIDNRGLALDFLGTINNEADRMTNIVRDLLELSRLDSSRMELNFKETDLVELVSNNVKQHAITAAKQKKKVKFGCEFDKIMITVDSERINQVLNNIITNSLRYSYEKALVEVTIEEGTSYYRIYVRDNGVGIPKEDLRRIFERFYRVDKARSRELGGTGLGLSIAKEIIVAHGGKISAASEVGKGTVMIIRLPKEHDTIDDGDGAEF